MSDQGAMMAKTERDWADTEDHDFLNEFVGCTISAIETGRDDDVPYVDVVTSRGRTLRVGADVWVRDAVGRIVIEEP